jgi:hypothetical protein
MRSFQIPLQQAEAEELNFVEEESHKRMRKQECCNTRKILPKAVLFALRSLHLFELIEDSGLYKEKIKDILYISLISSASARSN